MTERDTPRNAFSRRASTTDTPEGRERGAHVASRPAPLLALVAPCYDEAEVLPLTVPRFVAELERLVAAGSIHPASFLLLVDDGSTDGTAACIDAAAAAHPGRVRGVRLDANRGQQRALAAGLARVRGEVDAAVTLDCDGQDDPAAIGEMVARYREGFDVVCGVRRARPADSLAKRATAHGFYRLLSLLGGQVVFDHADFRLMAACVLDRLAELDDAHLYLRGLVPQLGFSLCTVAYERGERAAGSTRYSARKMLRLALDGLRCARHGER